MKKQLRRDREGVTEKEKQKRSDKARERKVVTEEK